MRAHKVVDFSNSPDCVLRISARRVRSTVVLADARLEPGACVVDLHYLNEHLPHLGRSGLAYGAGFRRRLRRYQREIRADMACRCAALAFERLSRTPMA